MNYELKDVREVYADGDIVIMDNVRELTQISPLKAQMNFIILCSEGRILLDINGNRRELEKNDVLFSCPDVVLDHFMISPDFECKILCLSERIIHELLHEHVGVWNRAVYIRRTNVVSLTDDIVRQHSLYHALISQSMHMPDSQFSKQAMQSLIQSMLFCLCSILYSACAASSTSPTQLSPRPTRRRAANSSTAFSPCSRKRR